MCVGKTNHPKLEAPFISSQKVNLIEADLLAISTAYIKVILFGFADIYKSIQESLCYKIVFQTTQPAHFVTALSVIIVSLLFIPTGRTTPLESPLWSLIYLGSFSAHFGAQLWMTFISGLSLYFALPRHHFGNVQKVLFPKYFLLNAILSLITLFVFLRANNARLQKTDIAIQTAAMTLCFMVELLIRLYLTPPLLRLMKIKNEIESRAGVGMEIGKLVPGKLLNCPHYTKVHKSFRKVHMTIAIGNIITMACTVLHLFYLSQKLVPMCIMD